MIKETNETLVRWSAECKKLTEKHNHLIQKKEAYFQPYTTTIDLFLVAIVALDQVAAQFDQSSKELDRILRKLPKHEDRSIKSEFAQEISKLKEAKHDLDVLEKKQEQIKVDLDRTRENLGKCPLNTLKHKKLEQRQDSLKEERKQLKIGIGEEKEAYQDAQKEYRINMTKIYQQGQKKELDRLKKMPQPLKNFIIALKIDPSSLEEAIEKHDPEADLTAWKNKHFSSSFTQKSA